MWSFIRGTERLSIGREIVDDGIMLVVVGDGPSRSYFFRDRARLEVFQRDMETLLLRTGWSFDRFETEHRSGLDRRGWPRRANDRRRWWTDGTRLPRQPRLNGELPADPQEDHATREAKETGSK